MNFYAVQRTPEPHIYGNVLFSPSQDSYYKFSTSPQLDPQTKAEIKIVSAVRNLKADYFRVNKGFVGSKKFIDALTIENRNGLRTFPANVFLKSGKAVDENADYYFLELFCQIDCFDFEKSDYENKDLFLNGIAAENELVDKCTKLHLREDVINGNSFFFISRTGCFDMIVNSDVAESLKAAKLHGIELLPIEKLSWDL